METIRSIVRNLVLLVLLVAFLEMLLPLRETRKFLQVIIGLFVLVTVLNPVITLLRQTPILKIGIAGNLEAGGGELNSILQQGRALQQVNLEQAQAAYVRRLEEQVAVMVRLIPGIKAARAQIRLAAAPPQQAQGAIDRVYVTVVPGPSQGGGGLVRPVERIRVGSQPEAGSPPAGASASGELLDQVRDTVVSLFGLRPEQVVVKTGSL